MYVPSYYEETDLQEIFGLIEENPLGTIVTYRRGSFDANHIPFLIESRAADSITLIAHVSRNNPLWTEASSGETVIVVFRGADGYISPNWYPGKTRNENQVPTWNFQAVNIEGQLEVLDNEKFVRGIVAKLTTKQEADQPHPWKMTDSEQAYISENLRQICGIRVKVTRVSAKYKLSQNRTDEDWLGAAEGVGKAGNRKLEAAMLKERSRRRGKG